MPIVTGVDVACPPAEVFAYATDPARFGEWQAGVVGGHTEGDAVQAVGTRFSMTRRVGGLTRTFLSEIIAIAPPRDWASHGLDGPIRADVTVRVEPRADGAASRVTISLDFSARGAGKMLLPMVVWQAQREAPRSCQKLKQRLETSG